MREAAPHRSPRRRARPTCAPTRTSASAPLFAASSPVRASFADESGAARGETASGASGRCRREAPCARGRARRFTWWSRAPRGPAAVTRRAPSSLRRPERVCYDSDDAPSLMRSSRSSRSSSVPGRARARTRLSVPRLTRAAPDRAPTATAHRERATAASAAIEATPRGHADGDGDARSRSTRSGGGGRGDATSRSSPRAACSSARTARSAGPCPSSAPTRIRASRAAKRGPSAPLGVSSHVRGDDRVVRRGPRHAEPRARARLRRPRPRRRRATGRLHNTTFRSPSRTSASRTCARSSKAAASGRGTVSVPTRSVRGRCCAATAARRARSSGRRSATAPPRSLPRRRPRRAR